MLVARATTSDLDAVESLLEAASLPLDGVAEAFATGVVAREAAEVVGAAAVEPYGRAGLLRSVVVAPAHRGRGIGDGLVRAAERLATELGIEDLYLLTETVPGWFAARGYRRLRRQEVPDAVRSSIEFATACTDSAVAMHRAVGRHPVAASPADP